MYVHVHWGSQTLPFSTRKRYIRDVKQIFCLDTLAMSKNAYTLFTLQFLLLGERRNKTGPNGNLRSMNLAGQGHMCLRCVN